MGGTGGINGAWVTTAYLIGEIIVIPMTNFLSRVFFAASLPDREHGAVSMLFGRLRSGKQPVRNDRVAWAHH
jgi:hypothetical protein